MNGKFLKGGRVGENKGLVKIFSPGDLNFLQVVAENFGLVKT